MKVLSKWDGGMKFSAYDEHNHVMVMDSVSKGAAAAGSTPMQLFLAALGTCSAMDIVYILRKRRLNIDSFRVEIEGEQAETFPKIFTVINIKYYIAGEGITAGEMERAVKLSSEKYCSIKAMIDGGTKINIEYKIED